MSLPKRYQWLLKLNQQPWVIRECIKLYGTKEIAGAGNNPTILDWAKEVGGWEANYYTKDSIPWCGLAVAVVNKRAKKPVVKNYLRALSWASYGMSIEPSKASLGDILVFLRNGGGHVGYYIGEDATSYYVFGGNQSDQFSITRIAKSRLYSVNRHKYNVTPSSVKPYYLQPHGEFSTNEA